MSNGSKFFSVMVIGENAKTLIEKYDGNIEVEPYIKYEYLNADKMRKAAIKTVEVILADPKKIGITEEQEEYFKERLKVLNGQSSFEYYQALTEGLTYDENGDALSTVNPLGKYTECKDGGVFSMPFILKNGERSYTALKKDVDWSLMHQYNPVLYEVVWELGHGTREPQNEQEESILANIEKMPGYFDNFKTEDEFVKYSYSYWNYATVTDNGWEDLDDAKSTYDWVTKYYNRYIKDLPDDTLLTIYECRKAPTFE